MLKSQVGVALVTKHYVKHNVYQLLTCEKDSVPNSYGGDDITLCPAGTYLKYNRQYKNLVHLQSNKA